MDDSPVAPQPGPTAPAAGYGPVLVIGASGNVGGATVRSLLAAGVPVRAAGTDPARLAARLPGVPTARVDLHDPRTFAPALRDVAGLFLVRPPAIAEVGPTLGALIDAARAAGVAHVVFSSVTGADTNRLVPHHRVEARVRTCPSWTILRPGFFAQNLADAYRADIVGADRIYLPAGSGRAAFIDTRDIGDVAARVFRDPAAHHEAAYTLTGPQSLGFDQVAAALSAELGRTITYRPAGVLGYAAHLRRTGAPVAQVAVQTVLHVGLRRGQARTVDPTLERLLGRPGRTLAEYVHDHRDTWAASGADTREAAA